MTLKIPSSLRRLYGHLNYQNLKKGFEYGDKILNLTRQIAEVGKKSGIDNVERLSDRLINVKTFNDLNKVSKFGNGIINAYDTHKTTGIFSPPPKILFQGGIH